MAATAVFILEQLDLLFAQGPEDLESELFERAALQITDYCDSYQVEETHPETVREISRYCGDDSSCTTNWPQFGLADIWAAEHIFGMKISKKDVHVSRVIAGYAEEWLFLPPSIWSTFDGSVQYGRNETLPFVLDTIKLKNLSTVRKQSAEGMEFDLKSKFELISASANWTNPEWLSYPLHQLGQILSLALFDFGKEFRFPFLHKKDGGCGGNPPWNNVGTALCSLYWFNGGRSKATLKGVMEESVSIGRGTMPPGDSLFLRFSHLAASVDKHWERQISIFKAAKATFSEEEIHNLLDTEPISDELNEMGYKYPNEIYPRALFSKLYDDGLVITEQEVKLLVVAERRTQALRQWTPMSIFIKNEEEIKTRIKRRSLKRLDQFVGGWSWVERPEIENLEITLREYYTYNLEFYAMNYRFLCVPYLEIFLRSEIDPFFPEKGMVQLISTMKGRYKWVPPHKGAYDKEFNDWFAEHKWDLRDPPDGIISDDIRLMHDIAACINVAIITNDNSMVENLSRTHKGIRIVRIPLAEYARALDYKTSLTTKQWLDYRNSQYRRIPMKVVLKYNLQNATFFYDVANIFRTLPKYNRGQINELPGLRSKDLKNIGSIFWTSNLTDMKTMFFTTRLT